MLFSLLVAGVEVSKISTLTPGSVIGTVEIAHGEISVPLKDATVELGEQRTTTNENGTYQLNGVSPGMYSLNVNAPGDT